MTRIFPDACIVIDLFEAKADKSIIGADLKAV